MAQVQAKRMIREEGFVLSKEFKRALDSFISSDGRKVDAQPDRYVVYVASSPECSKDKGLQNMTVLDYKVEKTLFDKLEFFTKVQVCYEFTSYRLIPQSVSLIEKK